MKTTSKTTFLLNIGCKKTAENDTFVSCNFNCHKVQTDYIFNM